jgi:autotransporter translocation and assembly factor TamB
LSQPLEPTPAPAANKPPAPQRAPRRGTWLGALLGLAAIGVTATLPFTQQGSAWLLAGARPLVPALTVQGPHGALLGDFGAERITWQINAQQRLVIDHARWQAPRLTHDPAWGLHLRSLHAERVAIEGQAPANQVVK